MARRRAAATEAETVPVPQSMDEANEMIRRLGRDQRQLALIEQAMQESVEAAKASAEAQAKPIKESILRALKGLSVWAAANRAVLTKDGQTKTAKLAAGTVAWRQKPMKVSLKKVEDVLAALKERRLRRFIRTKEEPDKEAMLKEPEVARGVPGVSIGRGGEGFYVTPAETGVELAE